MAKKSIWKSKQISAKVHDAALQGLVGGGNVILKESNQRAPLEEGALVESGKVIVHGQQVTISYDTPYAIKQHEDLRLHHPNGRRAKFLESALKENTNTVQQYVADEIGKVLHG